MAITTINESDLIKDSRTVINSNFTELDTLKAPLASPALTGAPTAPTPNPGDDSTKLATTEYVQEEIRTHANIPIGFEYFSMNPNVPQGSLPLFGGEYSRATYSDLWAWVQEQTGYLKTEAEWQALSTANNGNVPYYSDGDGSTTFRVPSLKCWVKGANGTVTEVGSYKAAGLPNITGYLKPSDGSGDWTPDQEYSNYGGAVKSLTKNMKISQKLGDTPYNGWGGFEFDASRSNSIYGNSTTVQPESIVGMWLVKAYGTVVDTGQIDEQQYIDDRIATRLPLTGGTMLGAIHYNGTNNRSFGFDLTNNYTNMDIGWNWTNRDGAGIGLRSTDDVGSTAGSFSIYARDGSNDSVLKGSPNGSLTWGGYNVITTKYQSVTKQYVSNSVVSQTQFARNYAWVSNGFLFVQINMNFNSGVTTSDITTVGKLKNVNIITDIIEVAVEQNSTFKPGLLCLYNNGSDVDIRVYTVVAAGAGRYGHWFTVPLR